MHPTATPWRCPAHAPRTRCAPRPARWGAALLLAAALLVAPRAGRAQQAASRAPDPLGQVTQALDPEAQERRAGDPLQSAAPVAGVHHVIVQYRNALAGWFTAPEREQLDAVDASGTLEGDARVLRFVAIDRGLRRFAPMALDAVVRGRDAERLRGLHPVLDERSALLAARCPAVTAAVRRRERVAVASAEEFARALIQRGGGAGVTPGAHEAALTDERALAADRAVIAASEAARDGEVAAVSDAAWEAAVAYGTEADRALVVAAALDLLRELVVAARGAPLPPAALVPFPAVAFDPLLDPAPVVSPVGARGGRRARSRGRAVEPPVRAGVIGACMDDLRCLPL